MQAPRDRSLLALVRWLQSESGGSPLRRARLLGMLSRLARNPVGRRLVAAFEARLLAAMLERTREAGDDGRAIGALFGRYEPGRSPRAIYDEVFSPERFERGYLSQMGQDLFLNRWLFRDGGPGFFVDVGAFDGQLGSNTFFFEKHLGWKGIAFEPNPWAFDALRRTRSCHAIQGCAYHRDGDVNFLALSAPRQRGNAEEMLRPANLMSLMLDPRHGAVMLSGIHQHIDNMARLEALRDAWSLEQTLVSVPCYRIDKVLDEAGIDTVDYLSIDVEGAELEVLQGIDFSRIRVNVIGVERSQGFPRVHRLLIDAGFEYYGLLFFDEIYVHRAPRFTWQH
jgi:FkbM family methyltransferase